MRRSVSILLAVSALAAAAGPVMAQDSPPTAPRAVYVCGSDAATSRSFQHRYGERPIFVSADEALAAAASGERWATPRCMTDREHRRLVELTRQPRTPG